MRATIAARSSPWQTSGSARAATCPGSRRAAASRSVGTGQTAAEVAPPWASQVLSPCLS